MALGNRKRTPSYNAELLEQFGGVAGETGVLDARYPVGDVKRYGAAGDGVTNDTLPITRAATAAINSGVPLTFSPGRYRSTGVVCTGASLRIIGLSATLIQAANAAPLRLVGGYGAPVAVSAFTSTTRDYAGDGSGSTPITRVTVSAWPAGIAVNQFVKVVSDDQLAGTRAAVGGTVARKGEYAVVGALDQGNSWIYLRSVLRDTYSTNVRLAVLGDYRFEIDNLTFDTDAAGQAADWSAALLEVEAAHTCEFRNLTALKGYGRFLQLAGLKGYVATNIRGHNLPSDPVNNRYGYAIDDWSCEGGRVIAPFGHNVRHVWTNNCNPVAPGDAALQYYGPTLGARISHGEAVDCSNAGFDTHNGCIDVEFVSCRSGGAFIGAQGAGCGFQVRGKRVRYRDCVAWGNRRGWLIDDQSLGLDGTSGVEMHHCKVIAPSDNLSIYVNGGALCDVLINGGYYEAPGKVLHIANLGTVTLSGGARFVTSGNTHNYVAVQDAASTVAIDNAVMDISGMTAVAPSVFAVTHASAVIKGQTLSIVSGAVTPSKVFFPDSGTKGLINVRDISCDVKPLNVGGAHTSLRYSMRVADDLTADAPVAVLTDAATIATDSAQAKTYSVTLGGNRTMGPPTNPQNGKRVTDIT